MLFLWLSFLTFGSYSVLRLRVSFLTVGSFFLHLGVSFLTFGG